jgi:hypothetical protein
MVVLFLPHGRHAFTLFPNVVVKFAVSQPTDSAAMYSPSSRADLERMRVGVPAF